MDRHVITASKIPAKIESKLKAISLKTTDASLLEIGCGDGMLLKTALQLGVQPFGVEDNMKLREAAKSRCPGANITSNIEEVPPHHFDLIVISSTNLTIDEVRGIFYVLASRNAFDAETVVISSAYTTDYASDTELLFRILGFTSVTIKQERSIRYYEASGSNFSKFIQERYVPGTWSEIATYEHMPRYSYACGFAQDARVLDFGCGSGYGTSMLADVAKSVIGLDISEDAIDYARACHKRPHMTFLLEETLGRSLAAESFDLVVCFEVIEHLNETMQRDLLLELSRLLTPDGCLLVSTPNPRVTALYGFNPYHLKELSKSEFENLLKECFPNVKLIEQSIHPTVFMQSQDYKAAWDIRSNVPGMIGPEEPAVYIGVCSKIRKEAPQNVAYMDRSHNFISTKMRAIEIRNQQLIDRHELNRERVARRSSEEEISRLNARCQNLECIITNSLTDHEEVVQTLMSDIQRLKNDFDEQQNDYKAKYKKLQFEFDDLLEKSNLRENEKIEVNNLLLTELRNLKVEYENLDRSAQRKNNEQETIITRMIERNVGLEDKVKELRTQIQNDTILARTTAEHLLAIERSTSWRIVQKILPLLNLIRPFRPFLRSLWRLWPKKKPHSLNGLPALALPLENLPAAIDISKEIALDPVWSNEQERFLLEQDKDHALITGSDGIIPPYVVTPIFSIDNDVERPKILHVIPNVYVGGSTQLIIDLVQHLSAVFEQEVLTSALWPTGHHEGLKTHHIPVASERDITNVIETFAPALVHLHYWGSVDDPWYDAVINVLIRKNIPSLQNINTPIEPWVNPIFSHYVFVSNYVKEKFGGRVAEHKVSIIYPGIDLSLFGKINYVEDRGNAIGMVYRLEPDKLTEDAIDLFIEIVRRRPQTKVYIVGGGTFLRPYIEKTIDAGVRNNFRFTGYVPYDTLPFWYSKFSIFVAPVWSESFGQVTPFAMQQRMAVAGYAVGALPEILGNSDTLGATDNEIVEIIIRLLEDKMLMSEIGERNYSRANELFSVETMVASYRKTYASLLNSVYVGDRVQP